MASIKISELAAVTSVTNDDVLIVNDGDVNTRKITYENLTSNLVSTGGGQTINGDLTINGTLNTQGLVVDTDLITVDTVNNRIGVLSQTPACTLDVGGPIQARDGSAIRMADADTSAYVSLQAPAVVASNTPYTLPGAYPVASGQVLSSSDAGAMSWVSALIDPMTTVGDIVVRDISNTTARLPVGSTGQVLTAQADGTTAWQNSPAGFADPMTTAGDIIIRNSSNITTRLGIGTAGQSLTVTAGGEVAWEASVAGAAGNATEVQFNTGGVLDASSDLTFDTVNARLTANNLTCISDFIVGRNTVLGDTTSDLVTVNGTFSTALVPNVSGSLALGSNAQRWGNIWATDFIGFFEGGASGGITFDNLEGYTLNGLGNGNRAACLQINDELNNNGIRLSAPTSANLTASYTLTLPTALGQIGETLVISNAQGDLAWGAGGGGGTPGGNNLEVQFNNNGAFGADANFTFDPTGDSNNGLLSLSGQVDARALTAESALIQSANGSSITEITVQDSRTATGNATETFIVGAAEDLAFKVTWVGFNANTGRTSSFETLIVASQVGTDQGTPTVALAIQGAVTTNTANDFTILPVAERVNGSGGIEVDIQNQLPTDTEIRCVITRY